jgi:hypothetical protein
MEILIPPEASSMFLPAARVREIVTDRLRQFASLRGVKNFRIQHALRSELPDYIKAPHSESQTDSDEPSEFEINPAQSVTGNRPVEFLESMNKSLVDYARSFELSEAFASKMGIENFDTYAGELGDNCWPRDWSVLDSFFLHPVERSLRSAFRDALHHRTNFFKENRSLVLEYLEL